MSAIPVQLQHLQLSTLAFNRASYVSLGGESLQQDYQQALTAQQKSAPNLAHSVSGPGLYPGIDGKQYFVPVAKLAMRANLPRTPNIAFVPSGTGWKITLTVNLLRPAGADTAAIPLLMVNYRVNIVPGDGTQAFSFAKVTPIGAPDGSTDVVGLLKAEGLIDANLALTLLGSKAGSHLEVIGNLTYQYTFTRRIPTPAPPPASHPTIPQRRVPYRLPSTIPLLDRTLVERSAVEGMTYHGPPATTESVTEGFTVDQTLIADTVSTFFAPSLMDFKPIYAVLQGTGFDGTVWSQQTGQGYARPSSGSDSYYVLPDSFRMALDANSGMPSMSLLLVETPSAIAGGSATYTIRVRLGVAPLLDGGRMEKMRESLRLSQNIPYAQLGIGGYTSATFLPSALFAQLPGFQSVVLSGDKSASIDAANGFELVLDCSLEFYTLLAKMLCSVDGLQGYVQFQIVTSHDDAATPQDTTLMVSVPVVLSFLGPFPMKLSPQVVAAAPDPSASSISVSITNPLQAPLTVSGVYPTLMNADSDLDVTTAASLLVPSQDTLVFAPAEVKVITVTKKDGGVLPTYKALAVDFGLETPTFDPASVLNHYQDLVAAAGINASAQFNCYLLKHVDLIPPSMANLIGMQVEVQHGTGAVVGVPLTRDTPSMVVAIPYTFAELLSGVSLSQPTFRYRAKSVFSDHTGPFSDWIPNTGSNVEITPI